ncbi:hypothetical protein VNI00_017743 [Paramarasmius palmivorus]|uniref:Uncharacterized protein n=1 Tax=Paramarasmius palmivorus TaxID=297713 RepID=A0AAW0B2U0_9AGAR
MGLLEKLSECPIASSGDLETIHQLKQSLVQTQDVLQTDNEEARRQLKKHNDGLAKLRLKANPSPALVTTTERAASETKKKHLRLALKIDVYTKAIRYLSEAEEVIHINEKLKIEKKKGRRTEMEKVLEQHKSAMQLMLQFVKDKGGDENYDDAFGSSDLSELPESDLEVEKPLIESKSKAPLRRSNRRALGQNAPETQPVVSASPEKPVGRKIPTGRVPRGPMGKSNHQVMAGGISQAAPATEHRTNLAAEPSAPQEGSLPPAVSNPGGDDQGMVSPEFVAETMPHSNASKGSPKPAKRVAGSRHVVKNPRKRGRESDGSSNPAPSAKTRKTIKDSEMEAGDNDTPATPIEPPAGIDAMEDIPHVDSRDKEDASDDDIIPAPQTPQRSSAKSSIILNRREVSPMAHHNNTADNIHDHSQQLLTKAKSSSAQRVVKDDDDSADDEEDDDDSTSDGSDDEEDAGAKRDADDDNDDDDEAPGRRGVHATTRMLIVNDISDSDEDAAPPKHHPAMNARSIPQPANTINPRNTKQKIPMASSSSARARDTDQDSSHESDSDEDTEPPKKPVLNRLTTGKRAGAVEDDAANVGYSFGPKSKVGGGRKHLVMAAKEDAGEVSDDDDIVEVPPPKRKGHETAAKKGKGAARQGGQAGRDNDEEVSEVEARIAATKRNRPEVVAKRGKGGPAKHSAKAAKADEEVSDVERPIKAKGGAPKRSVKAAKGDGTEEVPVTKLKGGPAKRGGKAAKNNGEVASGDEAPVKKRRGGRRKDGGEDSEKVLVPDHENSDKVVSVTEGGVVWNHRVLRNLCPDVLAALTAARREELDWCEKKKENLANRYILQYLANPTEANLDMLDEGLRKYIRDDSRTVPLSTACLPIIERVLTTGKNGQGLTKCVYHHYANKLKSTMIHDQAAELAWDRLFKEEDSDDDIVVRKVTIRELEKQIMQDIPLAKLRVNGAARQGLRSGQGGPELGYCHCGCSRRDAAMGFVLYKDLTITSEAGTVEGWKWQKQDVRDRQFLMAAILKYGLLELEDILPYKLVTENGRTYYRKRDEVELMDTVIERYQTKRKNLLEERKAKEKAKQKQEEEEDNMCLLSDLETKPSGKKYLKRSRVTEEMDAEEDDDGADDSSESED